MTLVTDAFVNESAWLGWMAFWLFIATVGLVLIGMVLIKIPKIDFVGLIMVLLAYPVGFAFFITLLLAAASGGTNTVQLEKDITELGFIDVEYREVDNQFTAIQEGEPVACSLFEVSETEFKVVCLD